MKIINMFAGPGAGKSTAAASVFAELKKRHVNCELVTEYAKDAAWERRMKVFHDQVYILGRQHYKLFRLLGEVDVVVTDAPILLGAIYNQKYSKLKTFEALALEIHNRYNNLNYFIQRSEASFDPKGRNENYEQCLALDSEALSLMDRLRIGYKVVTVDNVVETVLTDVLGE